MNLQNIQSLEEVEELTEVLEANTYNQNSQLIVYNDDFNTFDWVIQSFMEICGHTFEQSEQLSILVHFKGKAAVKTGALESLRPLKEALVDRGISAVIESFATE